MWQDRHLRACADQFDARVRSYKIKMASGRMNEACGLVRRLQSFLNDQAGADSGSNNASSSPAMRAANYQPRPSRRQSATLTTQPGASNPAIVTLHQIHQASFGYSSQKHSQSVPVSAAKQGKSSGTRPRPSPWTHEFVCLADSETECCQLTTPLWLQMDSVKLSYSFLKILML